MALMGLPNETLQLVGRFLVEEADLYAFILTHTAMHGLFIDQLYRNAVHRKDGQPSPTGPLPMTAWERPGKP
jgi:hypothetical protein